MVLQPMLDLPRLVVKTSKMLFWTGYIPQGVIMICVSWGLDETQTLTHSLL
jgi:hypothetical protein